MGAIAATHTLVVVPDDRDKRRPKTPPAGVRAQLARPASAAEAWTDDTANTPIGDFDAVDTISRINRRVKETVATTTATLDQVGEVRRELRDDIARVDSKVAQLSNHVGDLRETTGTIAGKLDVLVSTLEDDRESRNQHSLARVSAFTAEVEVQKTRALTEIGLSAEDKRDAIEARKEARTLRRYLVIKIVAGIGLVWGVVSTVLLSRCG